MDGSARDGGDGPSSTGDLAGLADRLHGLDGRGYGAYKGIRGSWSGPGFTLHVDHVQGDPYATPSRLRLHVPPSSHGIPEAAFASPGRHLGLTDFLLRTFRAAAEELPRVAGSGRSGQILVPIDSPRVLLRAGCELDAAGLTLRFRVGLPAGGRRCFGHAAAELLTQHLPRAARAVRWEALDGERAWRWIRTTEDHLHLQAWLRERDLVAFVRDGSILPRRSGVSHRPLEDAVRFRSPPELRVRMETLHHGTVTGMGLPHGVTVLTGGGFHGKTTLLEALQNGVVPHVPGDGREWVVTVPDAVKVRSEEGRAVTGVDLRALIHDLPGGRDTARFSTPDASGSTSLAADILESLEVGTSLLLLDEDSCATNLLVQDVRMQELVEKETIVPLIDRVGELARRGVSTILVTGGGGDYLEVADTVVLMEAYRPRVVTERAREVVRKHPTGRRISDHPHPPAPSRRSPRPESFEARRRGRTRVRTRGVDRIEFGEGELDLSAVDQLVDYGETRAVGDLLVRLGERADGRTSLAALVHGAIEEARREGVVSIQDSPELALPRPQELAKAANRLRCLRVVATGEPPPGDGPSRSG